MEFFINSNIIRILDNYQYYHCFIKYLKYLRRN